MYTTDSPTVLIYLTAPGDQLVPSVGGVGVAVQEAQEDQRYQGPHILQMKTQPMST